MAATKTQLLGGAFQDSLGNPLENGYLKMKLSQDATVSGVGIVCSGIELTIQLDVNGNVVTNPAQSVWANTGGVLSPINTYYKVSGYTAEGQRAFGPNNQQVGFGATFNLGSWVPNSVISWFPSVSQPVLFENDGTPNSSQTTLNLTAGSGVTLTDEGSGEIEISAGGGAIDAAGAGFWGPGLTDINSLFGASSLGSVGSGQYNGNFVTSTVIVYRFTLLSSFTINKVTAINLSSNGGVIGTFGIYGLAGNLLLDGGDFPCSPGSTVHTNTLSSPVTLPAGEYWHAQSTTSGSSPNFLGMPINTAGPAADAVLVWTANTSQAAVASNALSGNALPSTLGTLTPFVPSGADSDGICCPFYQS